MTSQNFSQLPSSQLFAAMDPEFCKALLELKADIPILLKRHVNEFGKFKFIKLPDVYVAVLPILRKHHFGEICQAGWQETSSGAIWSRCVTTLFHGVTGKCISSDHAFQLAAHKGMSDEQSWASTIMYSHRVSLMHMVGIAVVDDDKIDELDPSGELREQPFKLTPLQLTSVREALTEVGGDEKKFATALGVERLEDLPIDRLPQARSMIARKASST